MKSNKIFIFFLLFRMLYVVLTIFKRTTVNQIKKKLPPTQLINGHLINEQKNSYWKFTESLVISLKRSVTYWACMLRKY